MYADYHLDSPPPRSQYRRPWSPEPYDPRPNIFVNDNHNDYNNYHQGDYDPHVPDQLDHLDHTYSRFPPLQSQPQRSYHGHGHGHGQREASDVSVEALDLADYARTLQRRQEAAAAVDPYPAPYPAHYPPDLHPPPGSQFPPSPPRSYQPPSTMASRAPTRSSNSHASSSRSRMPPRRPISLPPPSIHASSSRTSLPSRASHQSRQSRQSRQTPPVFQEPPDDAEIDVSQFPAWSRAWYKPKNKPPPPPSAFPTNFPTSTSPPDVSPFDPGYINKDPYDPWGSQRSVDPREYAPTYDSHESSRNLLPWSGEPPDYGAPIDPSLKEERMRMLEREFGKKPKPKGGDDEFVDEDGKPLVGTVDEKGYLVTQGPKRRLTNRMLQVALAATAAIPAIYAAVAIKTPKPPPPAGQPAAYILYVVSSLSLMFLLYLFVFRPCCCGPRRKGGPNAKNPLAANGMMVLPVQGLPGMGQGKKYKGPKHKGKKGMMPPMGDVQVNLIVDPQAFGGQRQRQEEEESDGGDWDDEWDGLGSGSGGSSSGRRKRRQAGQGPSKRRSVFAGLAMEEDWKKARKWAKNMAIVDVLGLLLWGAVFVYIIIGKRCPSGGFEGWCNAYNTSTAAACLLCVSFGVSIFFDIQDLSASKASPRTR
ncbi:hypothetical protein BDN72DRAFT_869398 [Pluteus cervinus]|uniref:Uncharacterized protein n=1 Tax=Pluteus cervinus TaxID=181527 RepID=A0ACD3B4C7_9AGAR|nr:hypothetical protein BDN72DRAFT_869398 [Pluteus cervinus]